MYVTLSTEQNATSTSLGRAVPCRVYTLVPRLRRHAAHTHLFREGDEAAFIYEVLSGVVRLTRVLENGRRQVIAFGLPGDIIGFPNGELHHTDCDVVAEAEVVAHRRRELDTGGTDPETHQRLLHAALREISAMQDHCMMLARKSAMEKVASFLIVLSQRTGTRADDGTQFSLPMSRADIADFLGLTIETVSRMFSILRKDGTIMLETPQSIVVPDMRALIDASQSA